MGNGGDDYPYVLRPEARPFPYWKHHKRAKQALDFLIRVLKGATDSIDGSKGVEGDITIDTNRASRIFFVSGEPGSGKSTLYLTLRAMLSAEGKGFQVGYNGKVKLDDLKQVRWLDALDLEVAGDEGENLLAAVLVRLVRKLDETPPVHSKNCEDAIKELEELTTDIGIAWEGNLQARAGALDPDTYSAEVMRTQGARLRINERLKEALNQLAERECYGCSRGTIFVLPVDDFYLKPDASLQLLRLLRMISIPRLFFLVMGDIDTVEALFIEKSLADWTRVAGTSLFAEGSGRLDEALTRARELRARYLRKLLPPGQRETIEAMDWYEALNFEVGRPKINAASVEIFEELLINVKLDPPFHESQSDADSLLTFLVSPSLPSLSSEEKQKREKRAKGEKDAEKETPSEIALNKTRAAYTALQILDATPREIMDLGAALREVIRKEQERDKLKKEGRTTVENDTPLLLSCVRDIVNLVREEHSFLNEKGQKVLEGVLPTRHYSPEDINFEMDRLLLHPSPRPWKKQNSEEIWVRYHRSWDLTVNSKFIDDSKNKGAKSGQNEEMEHAAKDPFAKLPPRPAAWCILLHDLAWKWNPDSVAGNLVKKLCSDMNDWEWKPSKPDVALPANEENSSHNIKDRVIEDSVRKFLVLFETFVNESTKTHKTKQEGEKQEPNPSEDFRGWAVWRREVTYKHFPMPEFETFRDLDRFLFIWSSGLDWLEKPEEAEVDKLLTLWKLAGRTVLLDAYKDFGKGGDDWYQDFAEERNDWFKDFMETADATFIERFEEFKTKRRKSFNYPSDGSEKIKAWRERLDRCDNIELKKED